MKKRIRYRRGNRSIRVSVDAPDDRACAGCLEEFTGRRLNTHHWKEVHTLDQVRLDPQLALENSVLTCVPHHRVANALKAVAMADPDVAVNLVETMPRDMKNRMMALAHMILQEL